MTCKYNIPRVLRLSLALSTLSSFASPAFAEEPKVEREGEEASSNVGPDKAVTKVSQNLGFQLAPKAASTIGFKASEPFQSGEIHSVPPAAVVYIQSKTGVYRLREGWIKLVDVSLVSKSDRSVAIRSSDLRSGDRVAIEGVGMLRVTEIDAFGGGGKAD